MPSPSPTPTTAAPGLRGFVRALPREGRWLLSTVTVQHLGRGMTLPFTLIYLHEVRGFDLDVAGRFMALIFLVALALTAPAGVLTDRFGAGRVVVVGSVAQLVGASVLAFATTTPSVVVACVLMGAANSVAWPAFNAFIARVVGGDLRQRFFGVNFALLNLGIGAGGLVAGLFVDVTRPGTFTTIYLVDAATMLIPIALLLGPLRHVNGPVPRAVTGDGAQDGAPDGGATGRRAPGYLSILRRPAMLTIVAITLLTSFVGYGQLEGGMQAFARTVAGASTSAIGLAFAVNTVVIVTLQFAVLERIQGRRRTRVFLALCVIWALSWLLLGATGLVPGTVVASVMVVVFGGVFALGETVLQPTVPAITNDLATDHERGRYNATTSAAYQLGAVVGPLAAGELLDRKLGAMFIGLMVLGLALVALLSLVLERQVSPRVNGILAPETSGQAAAPLG